MVKIFRIRNESKITSFEIRQCRYSNTVYFEMLNQIMQSLSGLNFLRNAIQCNLHKHDWCSEFLSKRRECTLKSRSCYELVCLLLGIFLTYDYVQW